MRIDKEVKHIFQVMRLKRKIAFLHEGVGGRGRGRDE
jgi:hypothetical protein